MSPLEALLVLLDRISCGAVVLDHQGRMVACNELAQTHLREVEQAHGGSQNKTWARDLLRNLEDAERRGEVGPARVVRKPGGRPLLACKWSFPLSEGEAGPVLILIDPDQSPEPGVGLLKNLFGLSGAEARLASRLTSGRSLEDLARELNITLGTTRAHLRSIFVKTRTNRQSELVALLNRIALLRVSGQL